MRASSIKLMFYWSSTNLTLSDGSLILWWHNTAKKILPCSLADNWQSSLSLGSWCSHSTQGDWSLCFHKRSIRCFYIYFAFSAWCPTPIHKGCSLSPDAFQLSTLSVQWPKSLSHFSAWCLTLIIARYYFYIVCCLIFTLTHSIQGHTLSTTQHCHHHRCSLTLTYNALSPWCRLVQLSMFGANKKYMSVKYRISWHIRGAFFPKYVWKWPLCFICWRSESKAGLGVLEVIGSTGWLKPLQGTTGHVFTLWGKYRRSGVSV